MAKPVAEVNDAIRELVSDMFETMYAENGIGLAATQVDVHLQVVVMDISEERNERRVFINPKIIEADGQAMGDEGCLSVPGSYAEVERAEHIKVKALDEQGQEFILEADGLLAVCVQHELDHLKGKLFIDYLSPLKRERIRKKLEKEARQQARHASTI
ncbi:peptide deformylase [Gallaecimonas pentaromativorans]|uniref:Peptide deformylase n=1 Tax=Gallaecimonas pentaromativorans TaxID=584787 RepID=A0A3N1NK14_9GAMM|nr:peptide deformylase [Gallaecimonas pentaromativorans]